MVWQGFKCALINSQCIVLVNSEKKKKSLMAFVYRVLWILKALWIVLSETIHILRKLKNITFWGCPRNFYHRFMYIPPSSGEPLPHINLPLNGFVRRFEVVFWCLEWECCTFWKIYENSFKSTNTVLWL